MLSKESWTTFGGDSTTKVAALIFFKSMPSQTFLMSYEFFSAAVRAFQHQPTDWSVEGAELDVFKAYKAVTGGLTAAELTAFNDFALRLLNTPRKLRRAQCDSWLAHGELDTAFLKKANSFGSSGLFIEVNEFLLKTGMTRDELTRKLKSREMFKVELGSFDGYPGDDFIPAFFADQRFNPVALYEISKALGAVGDIPKLRFFNTPIESLNDRTPLDLIENEMQTKPLLAEVRRFRSQIRKPKYD